MEITKDMLVADVAELLGEDGQSIMLSYGLHCFGCGAAAYESLEAGTIGHGMSEDELNDLLEELNDLAQRLEQKKEPEGEKTDVGS